METEALLQGFIDGLDDEAKNRLIFHLLAKRNNDGLNGRTWDAHEHLKHETAVEREIARQCLDAE